MQLVSALRMVRASGSTQGIGMYNEHEHGRWLQYIPYIYTSSCNANGILVMLFTLYSSIIR